ncbi:MAG: tRNA dihydrouridine synthase DusB [Planctomycetota bacterium]|nr:MAG: tRNA dihydrouridine synthase DusB [Planctomycetota bacterium]
MTQMVTTLRSLKVKPAEIHAIDLGQGVSFDPPMLLAPMEGVTDRTFRGLVLEQNGAASVGGACTEFQRVTGVPLKTEKLQKELGSRIDGVAVGIQLMGNQPDVVGESARNAAEAGADFIDLNFGCPAPRVFQHCAGSALLNDPPLLEAMIRATVAASPIPVTAKIRGGVEHSDNLEEIAKRVEQAGATSLTVHGRLRSDRYSDPPNWDYIVRAKSQVQIPVIGNGNADTPESIERMFKETGCDGVMVGRGAMRDPWLFRRWMALRNGTPQPQWTRTDVYDWLQQYHQRMSAGGTLPRHSLGRLKQAIKAFREGGHLPEGAVNTALRCKAVDQLYMELGF